MNIRDAREELKENGVNDPFKRTNFREGTRTRNQNAIMETNERMEESLSQTQTFNPAGSSLPTEQNTNEEIKITNRYGELIEENLDANEEKTDNEKETSLSDMEGIEGFWGPLEPKAQRRGRRGHKAAEKDKGTMNKRSRETSPTIESSTKKDTKEHKTSWKIQNWALQKNKGSFRGPFDCK